LGVTGSRLRNLSNRRRRLSRSLRAVTRLAEYELRNGMAITSRFWDCASGATENRRSHARRESGLVSFGRAPRVNSGNYSGPVSKTQKAATKGVSLSGGCSYSPEVLFII
jgi:hypothetical protein